MTWLLVGAVWLLLAPFTSILLLPVGGPLLVVAVGAVIAWLAYDELDGEESAADTETTYWRTLLVLGIAAASVLGGLYIMLNGKAWNALSKAAGSAVGLGKLGAVFG